MNARPETLPGARPITTLLVANRGEIARRIIRTARAMGIRCVAVHVDADTRAPFVADADVAVRLPGSYLDVDAVVDAACRAGADAVHPGYGFLSENPVFAEAVHRAGLTWVGPSAEVIRSMGDKLAAKRLAAEAGVPILPSSEDPEDGDRVGFPLLVKAAAGGGGKGMRVVGTPDQLADAVASARREALNAFGDERVFLERYVPRARHVEIQVLADRHGGLVHLAERECSIQRRHQKIIEESPSPAVDATLRETMGTAALALARTIGYQSAGTVEFLLDDATGEFYFLEVNTRLQVEHPVTEAVTGIDLVREQLRIAAGETLDVVQADVVLHGHAIEARLYAEDPTADFLPAAGTLEAFEPPAEPAVRWDTGVESGSVVGVHFDPMLAKVIAHAPTRPEAAARLALALERLHLGGVVTNRDFLAATLREPAFLRGDTTTDFIERVRPAPNAPLDATERRHAFVAAALWRQGMHRSETPVLATLPSGFRVGRLPPQRVELDLDDHRATVEHQRRRDGAFDVWLTTDATRDHCTAHVLAWSPTHIDLDVDGRRASSRITQVGDHLWVQTARGTSRLAIEPRFVLPGSHLPTAGLVAPMPGVVIEVRCRPGDIVAAGATLVVLEAMKMEHHITAPADGAVAEVPVTAGLHVANGELLVVFESEQDGDATSGQTEGGAAR